MGESNQFSRKLPLWKNRKKLRPSVLPKRKQKRQKLIQRKLLVNRIRKQNRKKAMKILGLSLEIRFPVILGPRKVKRKKMGTRSGSGGSGSGSGLGSGSGSGIFNHL